MSELISTEPATGATLWTGTSGDADAVVAKAREAWPGWAATALIKRIEAVRRYANRIRLTGDELAELISRETGKPMWEARTEVESVVKKIDISVNAFAERTPQRQLPSPANMRATLRHKPHAACIVPENREERTTEGGLDAAGMHNRLADFVGQLKEANIRVSLFIEPDPRQIEAAIRLGAPVVEFHTGHYAELGGAERETELRRIADAAALASKNGIEPHAGHGLTFDNVIPIAAIPQLRELNIGHFLIGEAIFSGLDGSIRQMRALMEDAR